MWPSGSDDCWGSPTRYVRDLNCTHSNYKTQKSPVSVFIVTTSPCRDWVICAPAAFLGCGSRFSGSLSGVDPAPRVAPGRRLYLNRWRPCLIVVEPESVWLQIQGGHHARPVPALETISRTQARCRSEGLVIAHPYSPLPVETMVGQYPTIES